MFGAIGIITDGGGDTGGCSDIGESHILENVRNCVRLCIRVDGIRSCRCCETSTNPFGVDSRVCVSGNLGDMLTGIIASEWGGINISLCSVTAFCSVIRSLCKKQSAIGISTLPIRIIPSLSMKSIPFAFVASLPMTKLHPNLAHLGSPMYPILQRGLGGGVSRSLGFALAPVYIPDTEDLRGNIAYGKVVNLHIEFPLNLNTRSSGLQYIVSDEALDSGVSATHHSWGVSLWG